jgi:sulfate/thiosulfate-binding protein
VQRPDRTRVISESAIMLRLLCWLLLLVSPTCAVWGEGRELLNVSFDPTRVVYERLNRIFIDEWKTKSGEEIALYQSHGGSGKQARSVIEGLEADIVTLALSYDIDHIAKRSLLPTNWSERLPYKSVPCSSTIVFMVRRGNPKGIRDWKDLASSDISIVMPNPKTSGGARWNYLAAWGYGMKKLGNEGRTREMVAQMLANVPVFDTGARGSMTTFLHREIGDVLVTWESEARDMARLHPEGGFEIVIPSVSIKAETPVAVVDRNVKRHKTEGVAKAYAEFLFTPLAQRVFAESFYRPSDPKIAREFKSSFPELDLLTVEKDFGGWAEAQRVHFDDDGTFDQLYKVR